MKAAELLRLYAAGRRDFSGESLRGQNFKNKDLSDADFSRADIRGTNFTKANLTGVKFAQTEAGLRRRWASGLVLISLLLSGISGFLAAYANFVISLLFDSNSFENQISGWVTLAVIVVFFFLLLRKGLVVIAGAGAIAFSVVVTGAAAIVFSVAVAGAGAIAFSVAVAGAGAIAFSVAVITAIANTGAGAIAVFVAFSVAVAKAGAGAGAVMLVSAYVGWRALKGDERNAWIRSVAIAFASIGGTSFRGATLTDADFSQARLKSTDFRRSILLRTRWREADKLDRVRPGETYLNNSKIRELVITGNGQGLYYSHLLNLTGINLRGANLVSADFTGSNLKDGALQGANLANASLNGANLNCAYLQDADLSNAKLSQTQLDEADLTGTTLTGACIEDWGITTRTKLNGIRCDYVFMRLLSDRRPDQNPHRKPDDWNRTFADGEFVDFIAPMVETLDLYHNQTVDPRAVAVAFSDLRQQNPNADLEIISMEKRGQNLDKFNLRVRTSPQADLSQLHQQYFAQYEHLLTLPPQALVALLMEKEEKSQMLAGLVGTAITQPKTQIETYQNQGDTTVSEQGSSASKYDMRGAQFAGGFAETVQGDQVGGTINNQAAETPSLTEAAAEIQALLKQLEQTAPAETMTQKMTLATQAIAQIESNPTFKQRTVAALTAGGIKAFEAAIDHPVAAFVVGAIEEWKKS